MLEARIFKLREASQWQGFEINQEQLDEILYRKGLTAGLPNAFDEDIGQGLPIHEGVY